jgi:hypothetical protein
MSHRRTSQKTAEITERRALVSALYLSGRNQMEIAAELGVDQSTISRDLTSIQDLWKSQAVARIDYAKGQELAKIDRLEREYWEAWENSKGKHIKTSKKVIQTPGKGEAIPEERLRQEASSTEVELLGNPQYLAGVQWCIDKRCQILGVNAPKQSQNINIDVTELSDEQLSRIAAGEDPLYVVATTGKG